VFIQWQSMTLNMIYVIVVDVTLIEGHFRTKFQCAGLQHVIRVVGE